MPDTREKILFEDLEKYAHSRLLTVHGTRTEININDLTYLADYDTFMIVYRIYSSLTQNQKSDCSKKLDRLIGIEGADSILEQEVSTQSDLPFSCMLVDCWNDSTKTAKILEIVYRRCASVLSIDGEEIKKENLIPLVQNTYYFERCGYLFHNRTLIQNLFQQTVGVSKFKDLVSRLDDQFGTDWHDLVSLSSMQESIYQSKFHPFYDIPERTTFIEIRNKGRAIHDFHKMEESEHFGNLADESVPQIDASVDKKANVQSDDEDLSAAALEDIDEAALNQGDDKKEEPTSSAIEIPAHLDANFSTIQSYTELQLEKEETICGFACYFCKKANLQNRYILVFPKEERLENVVHDQDRWAKFQKSIYYEDLRAENNDAILVVRKLIGYTN